MHDDIALAVSEACTNVVMHAYREALEPGPLTVEIYRERGELVIVVSDTGAGIIARADSPGLGMGLALIAGLTQRMEVATNGSAGARLTMAFATPAPAGAP
jgi:anti-sigma regulatory factor (Ser/Thr protein kinase)